MAFIPSLINTAVCQVHLPGDDVHCRHVIVLRQQHCEAEPYIAGAGYGYAILFHASTLLIVYQPATSRLLSNIYKTTICRSMLEPYISHLQDPSSSYRLCCFLLTLLLWVGAVSCSLHDL